MIERLMNLEHPYGEPQYRNLSEQIISLKQQLFSQLNLSRYFAERSPQIFFAFR